MASLNGGLTYASSLSHGLFLESAPNSGKSYSCRGKPYTQRLRKMPSFPFMKRIVICLLIAVVQVHAYGPVPLPEPGHCEDFNSFQGTFESLPEGISVSKDGTNPMTEEDIDFRGVDDGNLSTGGCYAWEIEPGDHAL